jgi:hypothetical protein
MLDIFVDPLAEPTDVGQGYSFMGLVRDSAIECILKLTMGMVLVSDKAAR